MNLGAIHSAALRPDSARFPARFGDVIGGVQLAKIQAASVSLALRRGRNVWSLGELRRSALGV